MTTETRDGTAVNQCVREPDTAVYYGSVYASVTLTDLDCTFLLDPEPGEWKNGAWARERAVRALRENITLNAIATLISAVRREAHHAGKEAMKSEIRIALGFEK
jgi:hypothetical protein